MSDSRFMVKILSGLHTGAEYYLPRGETRLGSSTQCDLVLRDKGIAEELLVFTCSAEGVQVHGLAQDDPLLLDGVEQTGPFTITDFGLLTTTALYLAVGAEDKPWKIPAPAQLFAQPEERLPSVPEAREEEEEEEATEQSDAPPDNEEQEPEADDNARDGAENDMAEDAPPAQQAAEDEARPLRRGRVMAGAAALVLVLAAGLYWGRDERQPGAQQAAPRVSMKQVNAIAERYGLDASFELKKGNILSVEGYALNIEDEREFTRAMYDKRIIVKSSLIITEQFKNNIQNILEQYADPALNEQVTVSISEGDIKTLVLRGYIQDAEKWREILAETVGEVASINYIDEVTHWDQGYARLQELLDKHALRDRLHLEQDRENDRVFLYSPYLDKSGQSRLERLMKEYRDVTTHPEILFDRDLGSTLNAPEFAENRLIGASFNARPYLLFEDGQRYFVGSVTRDGYRVEEINEQFAVLSRDGQRYNYSFDDPTD